MVKCRSGYLALMAFTSMLEVWMRWPEEWERKSLKGPPPQSRAELLAGLGGIMVGLLRMVAEVLWQVGCSISDVLSSQLMTCVV